MNTLQSLIIAEQKRTGMSNRELAQKTGVTHTTIGRIIAGKDTSLSTLETLARYLKINPAVVISTGDQETIGFVAAIIEKYPALKSALTSVVARFEEGSISQDTVEEIVRYIIWRLQDQGK